MFRVRSAALVAAASLMVVACGPARGPGEFQADFKQNGRFVTRMSAPIAGNSPHGTVRIWYSAELDELLDRSSFVAPEGAVAIKEFDGDADGTIDGYAVMVKKEAGYDAEHQDWYYEMRDAKGTVMTEPPPGKTEMCISCHAAAQKTDYLAGTGL
jgi:hypothetical protein